LQEAAVREALGKPGTTADLFAGLGTFALTLPGKVYAAEGARDALLSLKAAAARAQRPVFAEHRDLFRRPLTTTELDRFDAVVIDPPRAGARDQAAALAAARVGAIAYVSCNPASFARDARLLVDGGWRLDWIQPVGQFRWSTHVELAARFTR
jgi:23S rRNA (uracil1939-C5)-methyltransferase